MSFCRRCGQPRGKRHSITFQYYCVHTGVGTTTNAEHAARIRTAYALGREHNPDHDTTDYAEQTMLRKPSPPRVKKVAGPPGPRTSL